MDRNLFLAFALSFLVLTSWTMLTGGPPQGPPPTLEGEGQAPPAASSPTVISQSPSPLPPSSGSTVLPGTSSTPVVAQPAVDEISEERITLELPLFAVELSSYGGGITSWLLNEYRETSDLSSPRVELVTGKAPFELMYATPFDELGLGDLSRRSFRISYADTTSVTFEATFDGVVIRKTYTFADDTYEFRLLLEVHNESTVAIAPRFRIDLPAHVREGADFTEIGLAALQDGSSETQPLQGFGTGGFLDAFTGGGPEIQRDFPGSIDWAGVSTSYFLSVILPDSPSQASVRMFAVEPGVAGVVQVFFDETPVPPGGSAARELRGYVGPKEMDRLEAVGAEMVRSVDLGWSWVQPLTRFFSLLLKMMYSAIPNYGVAIIVLTILVRIVTAPLTIKQMRSMERMRALSPKLKELQEKFKDDRQKQSEATMALYRSEKVNPLGGCLPMILQFPVFIGLFYALRSTIQLRQSPFFGWIDDLSAPESLFDLPGLGIPVRVLPLVMGATMVLQQKITPMQVDPAQARMMMTIMPIMMTFVFYQFPSGLVLYWMVSNVLAISHQLWIGRGMRK